MAGAVCCVVQAVFVGATGTLKSVRGTDQATFIVFVQYVI